MDVTFARMPRGDCGAATVWTLALLSVVLLAGLVSSTVAVHVVARQRISTVADIAALAAAQSVGDPCESAARAAAANDAALATCTTDGVDVVVTVTRPPPELVQRVLRLLGATASDLSATARAGPA